MIGKLLWNDIKNHKLQAVSMVLFMTASSLLISLAALLFADLLGSVNGLMEKAGTPDYLQMHAGELGQDRIRLFAEEHSEIEDWQISNYLNLENSTLFLGSNSLADSTQDIGLSIQGDHFDYLLDMENKCPAVEEGEVSELYYNGPAITKPLIRMMNALYPVWISRPAVRYG